MSSSPYCGSAKSLSGARLLISPSQGSALLPDWKKKIGTCHLIRFVALVIAGHVLCGQWGRV